MISDAKTARLWNEDLDSLRSNIASDHKQLYDAGIVV